MGIWYVTRESVMGALDVKVTADQAAQVDDAIEAASRDIDGFAPGGGCLHRRFYPEIATRYFDWPNMQRAEPYRLWLDAHELVSVTTLTVAGTVIPATDYFLEPVNSGPPYNRIEIDISSTSSFATGATWQRAISIFGVFGWPEQLAYAGALVEALDDSETEVDVSNSAAVGVGTIIKVESEFMIVTGKSTLDTAQDTVGTITANAGDTGVVVGSGAAFSSGEMITVGAEMMRIVTIAGNTLVVQRAQEGSVLAAHTNASVFAPRRLTVTRGALGTTATAHADATAVRRHQFPGPVGSLARGKAMERLLGESSGWARTIGTGEAEREYGGKGLLRIEREAYAAYGRKVRARAA